MSFLCRLIIRKSLENNLPSLLGTDQVWHGHLNQRMDLWNHYQMSPENYESWLDLTQWEYTDVMLDPIFCIHFNLFIEPLTQLASISSQSVVKFIGTQIA